MGLTLRCARRPNCSTMWAPSAVSPLKLFLLFYSRTTSTLLRTVVALCCRTGHQSKFHHYVPVCRVPRNKRSIRATSRQWRGCACSVWQLIFELLCQLNGSGRSGELLWMQSSVSRHEIYSVETACYVRGRVGKVLGEFRRTPSLPMGHPCPCCLCLAPQTKSGASVRPVERSNFLRVKTSTSRNHQPETAQRGALHDYFCHVGG